MKNTKVIRHGDVVLYAVPKSKFKGSSVANKGSYVLSKGSTTGHAHILAAPELEIRESKEGIYLYLKEDGQLTHEEHATLTLPNGYWFVGHEMEVDHFSKTTRAVVD